MLADPQTVTINGSAKSLPAIARGLNTSTYKSEDSSTTLTVSHAYGKRARRAVRLDFQKTAADPLANAQNVVYSTSVTLVIDQPLVGFSVTEMTSICDGLMAFLSANSDASLHAVVGGQS